MADTELKKEPMSIRKFIVVAFSSTYCATIVFLAVCVIMKLATLDVFLAAWAGFVTMVGLQNDWYFKRDDRAKPQGGV